MQNAEHFSLTEAVAADALRGEIGKTLVRTWLTDEVVLGGVPVDVEVGVVDVDQPHPGPGVALQALPGVDLRYGMVNGMIMIRAEWQY